MGYKNPQQYSPAYYSGNGGVNSENGGVNSENGGVNSENGGVNSSGSFGGFGFDPYTAGATMLSAGIQSQQQQAGQARQENVANQRFQQEMAMRMNALNNLGGIAQYMPSFASMFGNMPNANQYFNQDPSQYYKTSDLNPDQYFSSDMVNKNYDTALANLSRLQGSQMGQAAQSAGESAAARGLTNPTAYTGQARQQVMNAYAPQFGQLEQGRNSALMQNSQNLYGAKANQQQFNAGQLSGLYGAKTNQQQNLYSALMQQLQMRMQGSQNDWSNNFGLHSAMNNTMLGG